MKTKIEINGVEVEIEATDNLLTIKVEKEDETIEEFEIETGEAEESEAGEEAEGEDGEVKAFDEFEEEGDFDEVPGGAEEEEAEEQFEESAKLESFTSYLAKQTKK